MQEEDELPPEKLAIANVGRQDAKKHLEEHVSKLMSSNIIQTLGTMVDNHRWNKVYVGRKYHFNFNIFVF
ncbi:hypothetical protein CsSME_00006586 [Camellia sinensis var. sinensis]